MRIIKEKRPMYKDTSYISSTFCDSFYYKNVSFKKYHAVRYGWRTESLGVHLKGHLNKQVLLLYLSKSRSVHAPCAMCIPISAVLYFSTSICCLLQVNNYEIVVNLFHIIHNLTWYSAIVHKFTRIYLKTVRKKTWQLSLRCFI